MTTASPTGYATAPSGRSGQPPPLPFGAVIEAFRAAERKLGEQEAAMGLYRDGSSLYLSERANGSWEASVGQGTLP